MNTIEYQLKTDPSTTVTIPAEFASGAEQLIKDALDSSVNIAVDDHPYLANPCVMSAAMNVRRTGTPRCIDEVILRVGLYVTSEKMRSYEELHEAAKLDHGIMKALGKVLKPQHTELIFTELQRANII